jgi:hypothetical protein
MRKCVFILQEAFFFFLFLKRIESVCSFLSLNLIIYHVNNKRTNLECLITAAFGKPVVPDVKIYKIGSMINQKKINSRLFIFRIHLRFKSYGIGFVGCVEQRSNLSYN